MGNKAHPMEGVIHDLRLFGTALGQEFQEDDGRICEREEALLLRFDLMVAALIQSRFIQRAAEHLVKLGAGECSDYTARVFADAGFEITPIKNEDRPA